MSSADLLDSLAPLLDRSVKEDRDEFVVDRQEPFVVELTFHNGFHYGIDPSKIFLDFQHRLKVKHIGGGLPTAELASSSRPFTELLHEMADRLKEMCGLISPNGKRMIRRLGIVTKTQLDEEQVPPGVQRMLEHIGRPWGGLDQDYSFRFTTKLPSDERFEDRCIHAIVRPENKEDLVTLSFDFQRQLKEPRSLGSLAELLSSFERSALEYFEEIAEGRRFNVDIARS